jgi:hypothetical protein
MKEQEILKSLRRLQLLQEVSLKKEKNFSLKMAGVGLYNGLELAIATIEDRTGVYYEEETNEV